MNLWQDAASIKWWEPGIEEAEAAARVTSAVKVIKDDHSEMFERMKEYAMLYGDHDDLHYEYDPLKGRTRLTMNVIKSAVDQVVSRITKHAPKVSFLTTGGNRSLRNKAKTLTQFVDYSFEEGGAKKVIQRAFKDAAIMGTGAFCKYKEGTKICFERVLPHEILVDKYDGRYQTPRCMYRRKWVPKEVLIAMFPEKEHLIKVNTSAPETLTIDHTSRMDLVEVIEGWRLPNSPGGDDGSHIICTDHGCLLMEPWAHDDFPITVIRYSDKNEGFYGIGIAETLKAAQIEINKLLIKKQRILDAVAVPIIAFDGKMGRPGKMTNAVGYVYNGRPPVVLAPRTVPPELDAHLEMVWVKSMMLVGIAAGTAQASLPPGVTSGVAIQEFDALQDGVLALPHMEFQDAWMKAASWVKRLGKEIADENPDYSPVAAKDKYTVASVKWKDIDLKKDAYVLRAYPISALPSNPSGRLQKVIEMFQFGVIETPSEARRLLDFPDLEEANTLDRAAADYIDWCIEQMLDEGQPIIPEPFQDHQLALKRVNAEYCKAKMMEVPEDRLDLLRDFMAATRDEIKKAQAEQAQVMAPAAAGAPPATGFDGAPPTAIQPGDSPV